MTFTNRKQMTPGLKACKEMMESGKAKEVKKKQSKMFLLKLITLRNNGVQTKGH